MGRVVECVPNFSEGRRREVVDELVRAVTSVPGVVFLDSEMDPDHHPASSLSRANPSRWPRPRSRPFGAPPS